MKPQKSRLASCDCTPTHPVRPASTRFCCDPTSRAGANLVLSESLLNEIATAKLEMVGLTKGDGDKFPSELSGGMTKRVALARALALDPAIVFLDEPTSGLDPIAAGDFDDLIRTLQETLGLTVFSDHAGQ
jgi:ABC-type transporter Mla maintaining outer membrane lipid asymmetry ATPase subunit MlaF